MHKEFPIPLYETTLVLIVSKDIEKSVKKLNKKHKNTTPIVIEQDSAGVVFEYYIDKYYLILSEDSVTINTVCHEIYHLTERLSRHRNIFEEEAKAWIQGYLSENILNYLFNINSHGGKNNK